MKNTVKILIEKYKYNAILTLIIFILFSSLRYSDTSKDYELYINKVRVWVENEICTINNEIYIHIDDLTNIFSENVYYDKISGKIIITTYDNFKKIDKNDESYVAIKDNNRYFNMSKIMGDLKYNYIVSNEKIYVAQGEYIGAQIKFNRTEIRDIVNNDILTLADKSDSVKIVIDDKLKTARNFVNVIVSKEGKTYFGYVLKNNIKYSYIKSNNEEKQDRIILVKAEQMITGNTDLDYVDSVAINMYRLSGVNTLTKLNYENNVSKNVSVFATISNGYTSSNYDSDITTRMLNSQSNREIIIHQLMENTKNLAGVSIDFGGLKMMDKTNFTQFIKELSAVFHANNKQVIVNTPSFKYIEVEMLDKFVDYIVIQPYFVRTIASKTSGPISAISYVDSILESMLAEHVTPSKVILEIPAYSILWVERKGTIINAEKYNMKLAEEYIKTNNIKTKIDSASGQNYINYTKGITTYKMWLEDEYSAIQKANLANKYQLAGISIYKSGMEIKKMYSSIESILNK